MGFNQVNYARIRQEYETKYLRAQEAAGMRRAEVLLMIPEIENLDRALGETGLDLMEIAMKGGNVETAIEKAREKNMILQEKKRKLLVQHGFPPDYTEVKYECDQCNDSGFIDLKMCSCMKRKLIMAAYENSGMADLLHTQTFENFDLEYYSANPLHKKHMARVLSIVKEYAETFETSKMSNMLFMGGTGLGKTHLSSAMAKRIIDRGFDVFYASSITLFSDFEAQRFGNASGNESGLGTAQYFDCDLLIIDDLGSEIINQFTTTVLYNILNTRISRKKSTVINTNFTQEELKQKYWDRITSRLFGEYPAIPFIGQDIRQLKIKNAK